MSFLLRSVMHILNRCSLTNNSGAHGMLFVGLSKDTYRIDVDVSRPIGDSILFIDTRFADFYRHLKHAVDRYVVKFCFIAEDQFQTVFCAQSKTWDQTTISFRPQRKSVNQSTYPNSFIVHKHVQEMYLIANTKKKSRRLQAWHASWCEWMKRTHREIKQSLL